MRLNVGILALQGDFQEHASALERLETRAVEVRLPTHLDAVNALIIPGGESTTLTRLLARWGITELIIKRAHKGMPIWGTCAGAILLAQRCDDAEIDGLRLMDIGIQRNAYGRQVDSFEADLKVPTLGARLFHGVFIRAPKIVDVGAAVEVLGVLADGSPVAVRQGNMLATTFHPELTDNLSFHRLFVHLASQEQAPALVNTGTMD